MKTVTSKDGTQIAYDVYGEGHPVIMVGGTMNSRIFGPAPAAQLLGEDFSVHDYDRRGRGDSGDNQPYTPDKEIDDIEALIVATGGQAALCGFSSGGALATEAAIELGPERITKLAMYEGPFTSDPVVISEWQAYGKALHSAEKSGDVHEMVVAFVQLVHANDHVDALRNDKATWQKLSSLAPTLIYDYKIIGPDKRIPEERLAKVKIPTLVICGGDSGAKMISDTEHIARLIPQGTAQVLPHQSHNVEPTVIAPVLKRFFS
jgi:pimeloyl-ACP methyl ester carboxylesterase